MKNPIHFARNNIKPRMWPAVNPQAFAGTSSPSIGESCTTPPTIIVLSTILGAAVIEYCERSTSLE